MAYKLFVEATHVENIIPVRLVKEEAKDADGKIITGKKPSLYVEGIYIQTNIKNKNGRNYPLPLMEACVQKYIQERMQPGKMRSYGELGHPDGVEINLDKVCDITTDLHWDGPNCIGKSKILTAHPAGRIVETLLEEGCQIGKSTRGLGSLSEMVQKDGSKIVESYEMIANDTVADPSAPEGFVNGIMENKEYIIQDNGVIVECYRGLERSLSSLPKDSELRRLLFIDSLENFLKDL